MPFFGPLPKGNEAARGWSEDQLRIWHRSQTMPISQVLRDDMYLYGGEVVYTSSGSFVKANYPGLRAVIVECQGGGGAGGGAGVPAASNSIIAYGGHSGAYAKSFILVDDLDTSEAVTVGAGGTPGTAGNNPGGDGGDSIFDTISGEVRAKGGVGGIVLPATTAVLARSDHTTSATGNVGDLVIPGRRGGGGFNSASQARGGCGGDSLFGTGGEQSSGNTPQQNAGTGFGAGGNGASNISSGANAQGGAGAAGVVIVTLLF